MNPRWPMYVVLTCVLLAILGFGAVYSYIWVPVAIILFALVLRDVFCSPHPFHLPDFHMIWIPICAFGILVSFQWLVPLSVYPGATMTGWVQLLACSCVFYLGYKYLRSAQNTHTTAWVLWAFTGIVSTEAIFQYFSAGRYIYWFHNATYAEPVGPYVYHNHYAGMMDLLLPLAVVMVFRRASSGEPLAFAWLRRCLFPLLGLASIIVAQSRGGILALLFEAALAFVIFRRRIWRSHASRWVLLAVVSLVVVFVGLTDWYLIFHRFTHLMRDSIGLRGRLELDVSCWRIFLSSPLWGSGFNTFAAIYPKYQLSDWGQSVLFAHNDYAQALAETGLLGIFCVLGFVFFWLREFVRVYQHSRKNDFLGLRIHLAAFIGTAGFLFHSFGDFQFHAPANALLFFLVAALAMAPMMHEKAAGTRGHSPLFLSVSRPH